MWHSPSLTSPITQLVAAPLGTTTSSTSPKTFAVSYTDGSIRLWSYDTSAPEVEAAEMVTFNGHKKSVTTLAFDNDGSRLASGGTEGEIIIWDRVAEVGLFRLKGHRGAVTAIHFIPHPNLPLTAHPGFLVSTSRDTYLKLWDLSTQHCIQTVVTGRGEVCSCAVTVEETYGGQIEGDEIRGRWVIVTGSGDGEGRMWSMEKSTLTRGIREDASGAVRLPQFRSSRVLNQSQLANIVKSLCNLPLPASPQPILQSTFHPYLPLLFLQTADRSITICRLRSVEEIRTKRTRRKKREKEKVTKRGLVDHDGESEDDIGAIGWEERLVILCTVRANAKIKSFAFSPYEADTAKGGIPVSEHMLQPTFTDMNNNSSSLLYPITPSKPI